MTIFNHESLREEYDNENSSIANDFLVPCLKKCRKYRRTTYSFSSGALNSWAGSFTHIIDSKVKIEILCDMSVACDQDEQLKIALTKAVDDEGRKHEIEKFQNLV